MRAATYIPEGDKVLCDCRRDIQCVKNCIEQKQEKELVVCESNTVIHPWTVMVHFQNTPVRNQTKFIY